MNISICIPTYNRAKHLMNCLESISLNKNTSSIDYEICISDNCCSRLAADSFFICLFLLLSVNSCTVFDFAKDI